MLFKMTVRFYAADHKVFGPGIAQLLHRVQKYHSLRAAALSMDMAYSKAWTVLRTAENALGYKLLYSSAGGKNGDAPYYTNSSHLPVSFSEDIFAALDIQDELQTLYTSGTVFHAFLGEKLPGWESAAKLVKTIADNYRLPYYTLSPTYSVCPTHGYLAGEHFTCPHCGKAAEVYSRITGYYRPVQNWNDGKSQEYRERREYDVEHHSTWPGAKEKEEEKAAPCCGTLKLFTTRTCPNCAMAKEQLNSIGLVYEVIDAEEHPELAMQYGLRQAPTLIVEKDGEVQKFAGIANVLKFVDANRKAV